jgi:hypothetical protein
MIFLAGDCSVKKFVLPENKSVNDFRLIGGTRGDDAIDPGAPPTCGLGALPGDTGANGAFGVTDLRAVRLRLFFGIIIIIITITIDYFLFFL